VLRSYKRDEVKTEFRWKGATIPRGLKHGSRGTAIVGAITRQLLAKTLQAAKDFLLSPNILLNTLFSNA
jgi:hypothetical protein